MLDVSRLLTGHVQASDALRYGRQTASLPAHLLHYSEDKRPVVVWTSTRQCNLHCAHCYTDSFDRTYEDELSTDEARAMVDDLAAAGSPVLLISGGEPFRRADVLTVAAHAVERGMRVVFSTNGTLIDAEKARAIAAIGVSYVGISIDGRPETHNRFRGSKGAFERSVAAMQACQAEGIRTGVRFTLTRANVGDLPWLFEFIDSLGINRLCIYHLAPTGRGAKIGGMQLSSDETRAAMDQIFRYALTPTADGGVRQILTADNHTDAAYLWMTVAETQPERAAEVWRMLAWNGGNRSGQAIAAIDADGTVYADQFWRWRPLGNVRERPFSEIWYADPPPLLRDLRARPAGLPERCRACRFLPICNGNFRSRAEATTGDPWAMDPLCYLTEAESAEDREAAHAGPREA